MRRLPNKLLVAFAASAALASLQIPTGNAGEPAGELSIRSIDDYQTEVVNALGQRTALCVMQPGGTRSIYVCGTSPTPPTGVIQWAYTYCTDSDVPSEKCPKEGLLLTVTRSTETNSTTTNRSYYTTTNQSGCGLAEGGCYSSGNLHTVTGNDGKSVTTYLKYDSLGNPSTISLPNLQILKIVYNNDDKPISVSVASSAENDKNTARDALTRFQYNENGDISKLIHADGAFLEFNYDADHNLTGINGNHANHIRYAKNSNGLKQKQDVSNEGFSNAVTSELGKLHRLRSLINAAYGSTSRNKQLARTRISSSAEIIDTAKITEGEDGDDPVCHAPWQRTEECRQVHSVCIASCIVELGTGNPFPFFNCVNVCMEDNGCL